MNGIPARPSAGCPLALAATLLVLSGCGATDPPITEEDVVYSAEPAWEEGEQWTVGPLLTSIGTLDGPPESQLYRVMDVTRLEDGHVVVSNAGSGELRIYGADGGFIRSFGRPGEGPGEFGLLRRVQHVPPDTLIAFDSRLRRVAVFTTGGEHIRTFAPETGEGYGFSAARLPDGRWLEWASTVQPPGDGPPDGHHWSTSHAVAYGPGSVDTLLSGPGGEGWNHVRERSVTYWSVPYGGDALRAAEGDRIAVSDGQAYEVVVRELGRAPVRVRRASDRRAVDEGLVDRWLEHEAATMDPPRAARLREEVARTPLNDSTPSHSAILLDRAGNLWVENYRLPWDDDAPRAWSVFDPAGRWLGDMTLPERVQVREIGDDYILATDRDELGVESVKVFALERP